MLRWPYVQVRFPNGLPGAALPFGVIRRILPARESRFCARDDTSASPVETNRFPSGANNSRPP